MKNKDYWNLRAKKNKQTIKSTTNFNLIKEFEISILKYLFEKYLKKKSLKILELGCGNGVNLKSLKTIFPKFEFYGIDYSGLTSVLISKVQMQDNLIDEQDEQINFLENTLKKQNIVMDNLMERLERLEDMTLVPQKGKKKRTVL